MKRVVIGILAFFLFCLPSLASAAPMIMICNSTGGEKISFYTNDTMYVISNTNLTTGTATIKFFIATHTTWYGGTNLTAVAVISKSISTNSSGHVPVTVLWSPTLTVGTYDLIADMNNSGTFDSGDYIYNSTGNGTSVIALPVPTLTITKLATSPPNHYWYVETNGSQKNVMLHTSLTTGSLDGVNVNSITLAASGTGNDKNGISFVAVYSDMDGDGIVDQGESLLGYGQYMRDDGIVILGTSNNINMPGNSSMNVTFVYGMTNSSGSVNGSTYSFQLSSIDAIGINTGARVNVIGIPVDSAVKTVYLAPGATTTTTTTQPTNATTTTSTTISNTTTTTIPAAEVKYLIIGLAVAAVAVSILVTLYYYFFLRPPKPVVEAPQPEVKVFKLS